MVQYLFGSFALDRERRELRREGELQSIEPKVFDLLVFLIIHRDRVVSKDNLVSAIWQGRIVSDSTLTTAINAVRRAIDDSGRRQKQLRTLPRKGFRFVGDVREASLPAASPAAALPDQPSIAVLAFDNLSPANDQGHFADGIVEDMTTALGRIGSLAVVARNSSFAFRGRTVPAKEVGRQLAVRYLVEGSVRRAGQKLRLTAQLIEAETGRLLWADRYDGELADVFDLQDRIVASIIGAISPSVRAAEIERARLKRPDSLQAYDYLLRAYPGFWSFVDPGHKEALALLHKALELEPGYALALAMAAWAHAERFSRVVTSGFASEGRQAIELATAALAAAPDDPGVLIGAGMALLLARPDGDAEDCAYLFAKALQLDPSNAEGWRRLGFLHIQRSRPVEAMAAFEQASRLSPLDPMNVSGRFGMGDALFITGRLEEALQLYRHCLTERPGEPALRRRVCALLALTGEIRQARRMARDIRVDYPHLRLDQIASANARAPYLARYLEGLRLAGLS